MSTPVPPPVFEALISLGHAAESEPAGYSVPEWLRAFDEINRLHWSAWNSLARDLGDADLVALVKGLTLCEAAFGWIGGSVSAVIWAFRLAQDRDSIMDDELADWILARTANPYVPFGRNNLGARSLESYRRQAQIQSERKARRAEEIVKEQEQAGQRRAARVGAGAAAEDERRRAADARTSFLAGFMAQTGTEQLRQIASDTEHPLDYYPAECASPSDDDLCELDPIFKSMLIERLRHRRKGPWRVLWERLTAIG